MCVILRLFSALSHNVGALQMSIIIIITQTKTKRDAINTGFECDPFHTEPSCLVGLTRP